MIAGNEPFEDQVIEAWVDEAIVAGARLPRWGWKVPGPYNGATGEERVTSWQKLQLACRAGWMSWPATCSICGHDQHLHQHAENYVRGLYVKPICRSCHYRLHRRFVDPQGWAALVDTAPFASAWASQITLRELVRDEAIRLAGLPDPISIARTHSC